MSLNEVHLPGVVLAGLYKKNIVEPDPKDVVTAALVPNKTEQTTATVSQPAVATPVTTTEPPRPATPAQPPVTPVITTTHQPAEPLPVTPTPITAAPPTAPGTAYKVLGNNKQQVVIVVRFPGEAFLPEGHLQMLSKMLGACKLNLGDVAIVNDAVQKVLIQPLKEQLNPRKLLLFGVTPPETGLPLSFPEFKDQEYAGCVYLHAPSLDVLNQETEEGKLLKRKLWECLKKIFGV